VSRRDGRASGSQVRPLVFRCVAGAVTGEWPPPATVRMPGLPRVALVGGA
jgi:hypothetical protein